MLLAAWFSTVGSDTYWLVALGRHIATAGAIPDGIPFAAAPSSGWPNVLVLAELMLAAAAVGGPVALVAVQLAADAVTLLLLAAGARRRGASDGATATALAILSIGALPALVSVKLQVFSLPCFALLLALLRAEYLRPSRRVWLLVPLIVLWGNLHGAVLMGVAVAGVYLLCSRLRISPLETVGVGLAVLAALFINPATVHTGTYYLGVLGNEAARRGTELWARPDPGNTLDLLLIVSGVVLVLLAVRSRPSLWEIVSIVGLAGATAGSSRHGVWLLMMCLAPAALGLTRRARADSTELGIHHPALAGVLAVAVAVAAAVVVAGRQPTLSPPAGAGVLSVVEQTARGRVVLADEPLAESLAADGITVWLSNPIDAFGPPDQAAFLDFLSGSGVAALDRVDVVAVRTSSSADVLVAAQNRFHRVAEVGGWSVYQAATD
jgi:hypothetical protein